MHIDTVDANSIPANDEETVTVEFRITGMRRSDQSKFAISSSVAIIHIRVGKILYYRDYPNVAGIRKAAGLDN